MFCPNCGADNQIEQNFCRSCGLNLEDSARSLIAQIPTAETERLKTREKWLENFGAFAWYGFGTVLLLGICGIIYAIVNSMILTGKNVWVGLLLVFFVIFAALLEIYIFINEDLKSTKEKYKWQPPHEIAAPKTTGKLLEEKPFEPIPSVTENSTKLLHVENQTKELK